MTILVTINKHDLLDLMLRYDSVTLRAKLVELCGPTSETELIDFIAEHGFQDYQLGWLIEDFNRYGEMISG